MTQTQDEQNVQASAASTPDLSAIDLSTESANPVETSIPEDPVAPAESSSNNENQGFQIDGLDSDSIPDSPDPAPAAEQPAPAEENKTSFLEDSKNKVSEGVST